VPNGGWRSPVEAKVFKSIGVIGGVPDLLIIHCGRMYGLELKTQGGRVTPAQAQTHEAIRRAGAIVAVAHNIDEALARLTEWALLRLNRHQHPAADRRGDSRPREPP
jgi:hypothetical protein